MMLFIKTQRNDRGGNAISMDIMTIDKLIEKYKDEVFSTWGAPDLRYCSLNNSGGHLLKDLTLGQFEKMFDEAISELGKMLWYYPEEGSIKGKYPLFRKAVYEKYGTQARRHYDKDTRKYYAEVM